MLELFLYSTVLFLFKKEEKYTDNKAKPQGLKTATKPALNEIPDLNKSEKFKKTELISADASKPKNKNLFISSDFKNNPRKKIKPNEIRKRAKKTKSLYFGIF